MTEFRARIRSYRSKKGGADIVVIHTPQVDGENINGKIIEHAKIIADIDGLDGFIVIGLFSDGKRSMGYRVPERIPRDLLPAYVSEIVRRDALMAHEAAEVFDDKFEWVE
jgi:hypothetical protein